MASLSRSQARIFQIGSVAMTDPDAITYEVLTQSGTALDTLISGRVDFARTPADFTNQEARLVFRPESGQANLWGNPIQDVDYLFECYGGDSDTDSFEGAQAVHAALYDLWHGANAVTVASGVLMHGQLLAKGLPVIHPDSRISYMAARFTGKFRGL